MNLIPFTRISELYSFVLQEKQPKLIGTNQKIQEATPPRVVLFLIFIFIFIILFFLKIFFKGETCRLLIGYDGQHHLKFNRR
jgi:preprotein translocase subunit SecY